MDYLVLLLGLMLVIVILWDAFETVILPRRVIRRFRITSFFYQATWPPWKLFSTMIKSQKRRDLHIALFGPLSLIVLLSFWATGVIFGYALIQWSIHAPLRVSDGAVGFGSYLYLSGITFFTVGYGDVTPASTIGRTIEVIEAGTGFGLLAIVIGYLPVLYQSFSRREVSISLLDARAGSPSSAAELLRRQSQSGLKELESLLGEWERWSAELLESHISYPVLCYFRSQHDNQSWLAALTTVLDTCALIMVGVDGAPAVQARLTFAITRHAVVDIAQIFDTAPRSLQSCAERMDDRELRRLREILSSYGIALRDGEEADRRLLEFRQMYEPYVFALSDWLMMRLPPWIVPEDAIDNWKTSAWGRIQ